MARTVDAADIGVGDIVTVPSGSSYVTHRVVEVTHAPGRATLLLRGDGNEDSDENVYDVASAPRTEIWVPHAGSVVAWFSRAPGIYLLAAWVAFVLGTLRRQHNASSHGTGRPTRSGPPKVALILRRKLLGVRSPRIAGHARMARVATGVAVVAATPLVAPSPAAAAWGNIAQVSGATLATASTTPTVVTCSDLGSTVRLSWVARAGATHYLVSYGGLGADRVENEMVLSSGLLYKDFDSAREGRFDVVVRYGSDSWVSVKSNQVSYTKGNCG